MSNYAPIFPRSVSGGDYRVPFDHAAVEKVGARMDRLYREVALNDYERGQLIKHHSRLAHVDRWLLRGEELNVLPRTVLTKPAVPPAEGVLGEVVSGNFAFLQRIADYVTQLEVKYGIAQGGGDVSDDI